MKRDDEIIHAAVLAEYNIGEPLINLFIRGAEWADQHPRKGLWDGDRVIAWLKENIGEYYIYEDLKKEMED